MHEMHEIEILPGEARHVYNIACSCGWGRRGYRGLPLARSIAASHQRDMAEELGANHADSSASPREDTVTSMTATLREHLDRIHGLEVLEMPDDDQHRLDHEAGIFQHKAEDLFLWIEDEDAS